MWVRSLGIMESLYLVFVVWALCISSIAAFTGSHFPGGGFVSAESPVTFKYDRIGEVKKQCKSILYSSSQLKPDSDRINRIKNELEFVNGDWTQEAGIFPILPFDDRGIDGSPLSPWSPLDLVSFWVTDFDRVHSSKRYQNLSAFLVIGKTLGVFADAVSDYHPSFRMWPGLSQLSIAFQGIYAESEKNGGERVMCLLGTTVLPSREADSANPWGWVNASDPIHVEPPLSEDDQILLVLRFPMTFSLTKRAIIGEMRSLNPKSNPKYFDMVRIVSQLGRSASYEFGSKKIVLKACEPYPFQDSFANNGISIYKGSEFCEILVEITRNQVFTFLPNWRCNGTGEFCSKLGPFGSDKEITRTNGSFKDVNLYMQDVRCSPQISAGNTSFARVSSVFRAVNPVENHYTSTRRSGLSNMTIVAEGIWKPSSGQLCVVGCVGIVDAEATSCNSRICMYVPISFSILQRSIVMGTISSIDDSSPYFPLSFEKLVQPLDLWNYFNSSQSYYRYTKLDSAGIVLEKNEPFSFGTVIKKSLLKFPKLEDTESFKVSLSLLSEDLTLHASAYPDLVTDSKNLRTDIQLDIVSLGPLFGRFWLNASAPNEEAPYHAKSEYTEKQLLLNISAQLSLTEKAYSNFSVLFLEGLYDPHVGKMYLVGCRDVRASWQILFESMDLEAGMDCLIEVVVSYPPTTPRWLINPTAKISIVSQRPEDDALYFDAINLQTIPIMYRNQREDILSRRGVEGILRILTLSLAVACITSQLFYIKRSEDSVPFVSLVMLGVQALGFGLPLVTDAESILKSSSSETYVTSSELETNQLFRLTDYMVKLLVMVSFVLTLRLCQKVWKSRIRLLSRTPLEPLRVPGDKWVLMTTFLIHLIGFIIIIILHGFRANQRLIRTRSSIISGGRSAFFQGWEIELEEYVGLVQDFFLLPQIIGNFIWQIDCKPLRKTYFLGLTVVRVLPHIYDYMRASSSNPYFGEDYGYINPSFDFFSKFGDITIPATAVILAAVVHIQQRWNYEKLSQSITLGQRQLLPVASRKYMRLPSKSTFEGELVSVNGRSVRDEVDE